VGNEPRRKYKMEKGNNVSSLPQEPSGGCGKDKKKKKKNGKADIHGKELIRVKEEKKKRRKKVKKGDGIK